MTTILFGIAALAVALAVVLAVVVIVVIRRMVFRVAAHRVATAAEIPTELTSSMQGALEELSEQGFAFLGYGASRESQGVTLDHPDWSVYMVLLEPSTGTVAFLSPSAELGFSLSLRTHFLAEPTVLTGFGAKSTLLVQIPEVEAHDAPGRKAIATWEAHAAAIAGRPSPHLDPTLEQCLQWEQEQDRAQLKAMKAAGLVRPHPRAEGDYQPRWSTAVRMAGRTLSVLRQTVKQDGAASLIPENETVVADDFETVKIPGEASLDQEVAAYRESMARKRKPRSRKFALLVLVVTGGLFALSFSHFLEAQKLALLVGVVLFHELGHLGAMRFFGYRDTSIFFIPFFGAAATGRKEDPKPMEELVVLLAGPVPGLVVAAALWFAFSEPMGHPWVAETIQWLVLINWFNLLPVLPLDGGRVVQLLFTARRPWLDLAFRGSACAAIFGFGLVADIPILYILGGLLLLGLRHGFRAATLRKYLHDAPEEQLAHEENRLRLIFATMRERGMGQMPAAARFALATELTRLSALRSLGWAGTLVGFGAYSVSLLSVPLFALGLFAGSLIEGRGPIVAGANEYIPVEPTAFYAPERPTDAQAACGSDLSATIVTEHPDLDLPGRWRWTLALPDRQGATALANDEAKLRAELGPLADGAEIVGLSRWANLLSVTLEVELSEASLPEAPPAFLATAEAIDGPEAGRWLESPDLSKSVSVALACDTHDPDEALALAHRLNRYFHRPYDLRLRPPWVDPGARSAEEEEREKLAWATYEAVDAAFQERLERAPSLNTPSKDPQRQQARWLREFDRASETVRSRTEVDEETIRRSRAFQATLFGGLGAADAESRHRATEERRVAAEALGERLGQLDTPRESVVGNAEAWEATLWLPFLSSTGNETVHLFPLLTEFLSASGCSDMRIWLADFDQVRGGLMEAPVEAPEASEASWSGVAEKGSMLGLRLVGALYRLLGRRVTLALMRPVTLYFMLVDRRSRQGSRDYLETLWASPGGREALGRRPSFRSCWHHLDEFAENLVDRMILWGGAFDEMHFDHAGSEHLFRLAEEKRGAILIGGHVGSYDMSRVLATRYGLTINIVMFTAQAGRIMAFFRQLDPESAINIVAMDPTSVRTGFEIRAALDRGELVGILGDRVPPGGEEHAAEVDFLGRPASFPLSPFLLAAVLGCPIYASLCVRTGTERYEAIVTPLGEGRRVPRREQPARARELLEAYVRVLEDSCRAHPYQWFNFFPFWNDVRNDVRKDERRP